MRLKGFLLTLAVVLALIFAVANWGVLTESVPVNFLLFRVPLALGLVLLLAALAMAAVFFFLGLWDRGVQLRRVTHLEKQIETLSKKLEQKRITELEHLESRLTDRMALLGERLEGMSGDLQSTLEGHREALEASLLERTGRLEDRVLLVRNELAADVAQVEDALRGEMQGRTPALPGPSEKVKREE